MLSAEELETTNEKASNRKPFDPYLRFVEMPFSAVFYPLGFPMEFSTNSEDIFQAAHECWGEFRRQFDTPPLQVRIGLVEDGSTVCPPGPSARAHRGIIVRIADQDNFHVADLAQNDSFAWVTTATVSHRSYLRYHFLEAVALTHIAGRQTAAIHAACVESNGRGVLLCGESGAGKSSLAFACARAGWTYITDDASFLIHGRTDRKVVGNCHLIRLRPSAAELFAEVEGKPQTQRAEGKPSIELFTSSMPEITTAGSSEIDCVVFLNRSSGNTGELTPFPREAARRYMHQNLSGLEDFRKQQITSVERLLTADTFELHYRDLDQAVERLGRLVRGARIVPVLSDPEQLNMTSRLKSWILEKELSREFWIFFVAALCYDFGFAMFLFLYNLFLLDHGFNERQLGLIAGAMTLGSVVATIPVGIIAQRVGLKRVLLTAFTLLPPISMVRLFLLGERVQVGLAFLTGLSICCWAVSFCPIAAKITIAKNRTFAFSLLMSVGIAAGGLGGLVGGFLPGWLQLFSPSLHAAEAKRVVLLLCCVIVAVGIWPVTRLSLRNEQERQTSPWSFDRYLVRYLPAIALWSLASGAFIPFATAYLSRYVHVPLPHIGLIVSASQLAQVVAILFAPAVFRRCGQVVGITYTQLATAIALAALAKTHNISLIVALFLGFTGFHWMGGPGIYSLLMERVAEGKRSTASAANNLVTSLCQAVAAPIAGAAYVDFGYPTVLSAIAGVALLAAFLFWLLLRDPHRIHEGVIASA